MNFDDVHRLLLNYSGRGIRFCGNFSTWQDALAVSKGYDELSILQRAAAATNKVLSGDAAYERDGVAFSIQNYPFPLVACLQKAFIDQGRLSVLDFGGALGNLYHQLKSFSRDGFLFRWSVVEQQHFIDWGKANLETETLSFHRTVNEAIDCDAPNVVLFSGVLQYLENWKSVVETLKNNNKICSIVVDRTPFLANPKVGSQIAVQKIPKSIVRSSYPIRLFKKSEFLQAFSEIGFSLDFEWDAIDPPMGGLKRKIVFKGLFLNRV